MISMWGSANREKEEAVMKAGGIRVPSSAVNDFHLIIRTAFHNMQDSFEKHNIVLDPMFLEEIEILEVEMLDHFIYFLRDLKDETKDYKVLTKKMAKEAVGEEVRGAFGYFSTLISDCKFVLSGQAKIIMRRVERYVFVHTTNHTNNWKY